MIVASEQHAFIKSLNGTLTNDQERRYHLAKFRGAPIVISEINLQRINIVDIISEEFTRLLTVTETAPGFANRFCRYTKSGRVQQPVENIARSVFESIASCCPLAQKTNEHIARQ
jgi:hypothetical protein